MFAPTPTYYYFEGQRIVCIGEGPYPMQLMPWYNEEEGLVKLGETYTISKIDQDWHGTGCVMFQLADHPTDLWNYWADFRPATSIKDLEKLLEKEPEPV